MNIKGTSAYKNRPEANALLELWAAKIQQLNNCRYEKIIIDTSLGKTIVWGYNTKMENTETIVIFPGFRTSSLFWDFDNALQPLKEKYRLYLVEINGQPNLSDGNSPSIKTNEYGDWATEVLTKLSIGRATISGASFGGIICMKLALVSPHLIDKMILMNPAGISGFSSSFKNLYYNFLPIIFKTRRSVIKFADKIALNPPHHDLPPACRELLIDYIYYTLTNFKNRADLPAALPKEDLKKISTPVYLVLGENDLIFPCSKTIDIAQKNITTLRNIKILIHTAHGIATSKPALQTIASIMSAREKSSGKSLDKNTANKSHLEIS